MSIFWFHSWYNPINSIIIKKNLILVQIIKLTILNKGIIGKIKAISTSKIKKIIVIKKKCKEKGIRAIDLGSNPHSNGDAFSWSIKDFLDKIKDKIIKIIEIKRKIEDRVNIKIIIYIKIIKLFEWKSNILNILYKYIIINFLINKLKYKGIIKQHQQNVNIMLLLQIRNDDL